jgi:hypothetical protein
LLVASLLALLGAPARAEPPPEFEQIELRSANGAALLSWTPGEVEYELEEAGDPEFIDAELRYRGSFSSLFVSGRRDGTRYFRVRSRSHPGADDQPGVWSEWSAPGVVRFEHHRLDLALLVFGCGAAVFLATCLAAVHGSRTTARDAQQG